MVFGYPGCGPYPSVDPEWAIYGVVKTGNDGSQTKNWFDKLGRELRKDVKGFNGAMNFTNT